MNTHNVFQLLKGTWKLSRTINRQGTMQGLGRFTEITPHELFYREDGIFTSTHLQTFTVHREYVYRYENNTISVFHPDNQHQGALLHTLDFTSTNSQKNTIKATAHHLCNKDAYDALYTFFENMIEVEYSINGPKKSDVITTKFERE